MGVSLVSNPPYNMRWTVPDLAGFMPQYTGYAIPPKNNANYAFVLSALRMIDGRAVILLPNSALASNDKSEVQIRKQLIEENYLLAVITLPGGMFESTSIPTCIMVFDKRKRTRRIAMIDLTERCEDSIRDQRGQFGGSSHEGRTYHKTIKVIPEELMERCLKFIEDGTEEPDLCVWVSLDCIKENDYTITPRRYIGIKSDPVVHRPFSDIANDYNRIIKQKNAINIRMNKTAAKRLGYDCMDRERLDLTESFAVVGQKVEKENCISFGADDGIRITVSTKEGIHPLIIDFLNHWKQMIMYLNTEENRLLAEFRDALLPELMSGKIEVGGEEDADA